MLWIHKCCRLLGLIAITSFLIADAGAAADNPAAALAKRLRELYPSGRFPELPFAESMAQAMLLPAAVLLLVVGDEFVRAGIDRLGTGGELLDEGVGHQHVGPARQERGQRRELGEDVRLGVVAVEDQHGPFGAGEECRDSISGALGG